VLPTRVEWPTVAVAFSIAAGFAATLRWHDELPTAIVVAALAVLATWYNSLQHEVIHGHPTPSRRINNAMTALPVGLVIPFDWYRSSHLAHHRDEHLTDPTLDPESFYVSAAAWESYGRAGRALLWVLSTLPGRMLAGPPVLTIRMIAAGWSALRDRPVDTALRMGRHLFGVAAVLAVVIASGLDVWVYLLGAVWLGWSISLLRSFAEHRFVDGGTQSAVVRAGPVMSLLFLNNNLHLSHHARPGVPWYELPAVHRRLDADAGAAEGAGLYTGYFDVARRFAVRPFCQPVHPGWATHPDDRIRLGDR
jgi:fatty acid desaturase